MTAQRESEQYQQMPTREMSHRVKNSLVVVTSFVACPATVADEIRLDVCDNGWGLPPSFRIDTVVHSLGKRVILAFARQLNGKMTAVTGERRTCFTLKMPRPL